MKAVSVMQAKVRLIVLVGMMSLTAAPALAQGTGYDANCNPKDYTADELLQQELCSAHIGCRLTMKAANSACKVKDFFSNLGSLLGGRSTPDNYDVMEALNRTEVVQTPGVRQTNSAAARDTAAGRRPSYDRSNAAQVDWQQSSTTPPNILGAPVSYLNKGEGGYATWFEGKDGYAASGQRNQTGTLIDSKGDIKSGTILNGQILGNGVRRAAADGSWAGGPFDSNGLNGQGYTSAPDGTGKPPVLEGTFKNGLADGMMLVTWPDFSSRKELWKDGKFIAAGPIVARGQVPPNPKTPEEEAAEKAAAEKAKFEADLAKLPNAGAVYAFADEWAAKGDMDKARTAWRSLMTRFPESPLAVKAADRLGGGSGSGTSSGGTVSGTTGVSSNRPASDGYHDVTLVDRWAGVWESEPLLRVSEAEYDRTVENLKACNYRYCGADRPISESPYAYNVGNIVNPFKVSGAVPQQTPNCKYTPQAGYSLPYLPGSHSAFGLGGGVPGEQTCAYLLQAAIHEWMENKVGAQRGANALLNSAPIMPGTATGQCKADLDAYRAESNSARGQVSPMDMMKSLQLAMYLELNYYRILTTSCKGTSYEDSADTYLQAAGQSMKTCQIMSSDPNVCVPKAPY